jgi:hypothetical protein
MCDGVQQCRQRAVAMSGKHPRRIFDDIQIAIGAEHI